MFDSIDFERLRGIGFAPALTQPLATMLADFPDSTPMRVIEVQREGLLLHDGAQQREARTLPALRHALDDEGDALACGDWVLAERNAFGEWWAAARLPPVNQLARRLHDGRDKVTRTVIVANVDTVLVAMGLDHDFNLRRLERYVALVRMAGVGAVVVLTKADLAPNVNERLHEVRALLPAGVDAVAVNALGDEAAAALAPWLQRGQTLVLVGSSGTGKSTLTNALVGEARQLTGANRDDDSRGRHTTTVRSLHVTPEGACIIDTPGLRTLRLDGDADGLAAAFGDIGELAAQCRFRDCRHHDEPGCAVREAIGPERLANFHKLQREARRDTLTALERKAQQQVWKVRSKAARARTHAKRS